MAARAFDYTTWPQSTLLLNASLTARGTELQGDDSRLSCARASLAAGLRLTTAAIGGSITAGSSYGTGSAGASFLYHSKVSQAINAMYPVQGGHPHHNGGVPGTGPTYMEHCVHDHLPKAAGLILLEYAVNVDRHHASFERLLRRLLISQPQAALIVLNHHRWRVVRPHDGRTDKCWNPKWPVGMAAPNHPRPRPHLRPPSPSPLPSPSPSPSPSPGGHEGQSHAVGGTDVGPAAWRHRPAQHRRGRGSSAVQALQCAAHIAKGGAARLGGHATPRCTTSRHAAPRRARARAHAAPHTPRHTRRTWVGEGSRREGAQRQP